MGHGGHRYVIYDNGEIEGFGNGAIIYNHYPQRLLENYQLEESKGIVEFGLPQATSDVTADSLGAAHGTPE